MKNFVFDPEKVRELPIWKELAPEGMVIISRCQPSLFIIDGKYWSVVEIGNVFYRQEFIF